MFGPSEAAPYGVPRPVRPEGPRAHRWLLFAGIGVVAIVVVGVVLWFSLPRPGRSYGFWFPLGGLLVVFLVLWLSFTVIRIAWWSSRRERYRAARASGRFGGPGFDPAIRVARMRYARGEITREQYDQIVRGLRPGPPAP